MLGQPISKTQYCKHVTVLPINTKKYTPLKILKRGWRKPSEFERKCQFLLANTTFYWKTPHENQRGLGEGPPNIYAILKKKFEKMFAFQF